MPSRTEPRMTIATQLVLQVLLADPAAELYGLEVGQQSGLPSGTIHPILARLEGIGWVESEWEDIDPRAEGRPQRRYYRLTATGADSAREAVSRAYRGRAALRPRPLGGTA